MTFKLPVDVDILLNNINGHHGLEFGFDHPHFPNSIAWVVVWFRFILENSNFITSNNILEETSMIYSVFCWFLAQILAWCSFYSEARSFGTISRTLFSSQDFHVKFAFRFLYPNLIFHQLLECSDDLLEQFYSRWII